MPTWTRNPYADEYHEIQSKTSEEDSKLRLFCQINN